MPMEKKAVGKTCFSTIESQQLERHSVVVTQQVVSIEQHSVVAKLRVVASVSRLFQQTKQFSSQKFQN